MLRILRLGDYLDYLLGSVYSPDFLRVENLAWLWSVEGMRKKKKERERERREVSGFDDGEGRPSAKECRLQTRNRFFPRVNGRKYSPTKNSRIRPMLDLWNHRKQICVKFKSL